MSKVSDGSTSNSSCSEVSENVTEDLRLDLDLFINEFPAACWTSADVNTAIVIESISSLCFIRLVNVFSCLRTEEIDEYN
jgi:hypothetical protein